MIFDPKAIEDAPNAKPPWKWKNVDVMSPWILVPEGNKIKALHAWVEISGSPPSPTTGPSLDRLR
jgi:hypothetical protein